MGWFGEREFGQMFSSARDLSVTSASPQLSQKQQAKEMKGLKASVQVGQAVKCP